MKKIFIAVSKVLLAYILTGVLYTIMAMSMGALQFMRTIPELANRLIMYLYVTFLWPFIIYWKSGDPLHWVDYLSIGVFILLLIVFFIPLKKREE